MKNLLKKTLLLIFVMITLYSCPDPATLQTIEIEGIGWYIENIDDSFWSDGFDGSSCFISFYLHYTGDSITYSDIESVTVDDGSGGWDLTIGPDDINTEDNTIALILLYGSAHRIKIGNYDFEVILTNGETASYSFTVPAPGSTSTNGDDYVYTEDYSGTIGSNYSTMLKRATNISGTKNASDLNISFSVSDSRVFNGWVYFFDSSDNYVGASDYFRSYSSSSISSFINGGAGIYNNNSINNLTLPSGDITFASGQAFSDISRYFIVLTDGNQYANQQSTYDTNSIAAKNIF